jgi:hypothetical protein
MAMRIRPRGDHHPLHGYAPAFDISNALPGICKGTVQGLLEENWPEWFRTLNHELRFSDIGVKTAEDLHGALLLYIRAVKLMQVDADITTVDQAFAATGFDQVEPAIRALVMARVMDYVSALFLTAIKDATKLVEGGTPVRTDVQAALDEVQAATGGRRRRRWPSWPWRKGT